MEHPLFGAALNSNDTRTLHVQICDMLRRRLQAGALTPGQRLPSSRKLSEELGVSRATVSTAYDQLTAEGYLVSKPRAGIFVSDTAQAFQDSAQDTGLDTRVVHTGRHAAQITQVQAPATQIATLQAKAFRPGVPDPRLMPTGQWAKSLARVSRLNRQTVFHDDHAFGYGPLRQQVCHFLSEWRGLKTSPNNIIITAGSVEALDICIRALLPPREGKAQEPAPVAAIENPSYQQLRSILHRYGVQAIPLPMQDSLACVPTHSAGNASEGQTPQMAFLTPSSQFPLGGALPLERRLAFLQWAAEQDIVLIEDDYDSEFRFAGRPIPAMASFDQRQMTIYMGSFSKVLGRNTRLGYMVVPARFHERFLRTFPEGTQAALLMQHIMADFMERGAFYRHIRKLRRIYADRRATMLHILNTYFSDMGTVDDHKAGLHLVLKFHEPLNDTAIEQEAHHQQIYCQALSPYYISSPNMTARITGLLLGFTTVAVSEMESGLKTLRKIITSYAL